MWTTLAAFVLIACSVTRSRCAPLSDASRAHTSAAPRVFGVPAQIPRRSGPLRLRGRRARPTCAWCCAPSASSTSNTITSPPSLAELVHSGTFTKRMVNTDRGDYTASFKGKKDSYVLTMTPKNLGRPAPFFLCGRRRQNPRRRNQGGRRQFSRSQMTSIGTVPDFCWFSHDASDHDHPIIASPVAPVLASCSRNHFA